VRRPLAALAFAALLASWPAGAQSTDAALRQAKAARTSGDLNEAARLVQGVLRREPLNYLALYNMGLIAEARAQRFPPGPDRARHLRDAAQWLERARAQRGPQKIAEATIFNTLGAVYLQLGELQKAEAALMEGRRNEAALSAASRGRLYSNIGYLNALKGDTKAALPALEEATRLGNANAAANYERVKEQDARVQTRQPAAPPRAP
jgi:tetratricopeptide (TPR) repeat protein